jgi:thiol-disulfide isomerase/thioredoxin
MKKLDHIIEFYGETCPHCVALRPIVEGIEKDREVEIQKLEVWDNAENKKLMMQYEDIIGEACGGFAAVPALVNTKTKQALCGAHDAKEIEALIDGMDCKDNVCKPHSKL